MVLSLPNPTHIIHKPTLKSYLSMIALIMLITVPTTFAVEEQDDRHPDYIDPKNI